MTSVSLSEHVRRGDLLAAACPSREVLMHVTSRWDVLVFMALLGGAHRVSHLRRKVGGVSEKMLAQTLRNLDDDGFVERRQMKSAAPHVEYSLTPLGREFGRRLAALAHWIEANMPAIASAQRKPGPKG